MRFSAAGGHNAAEGVTVGTALFCLPTHGPALRRKIGPVFGWIEECRVVGIDFDTGEQDADFALRQMILQRLCCGAANHATAFHREYQRVGVA